MGDARRLRPLWDSVVLRVLSQARMAGEDLGGGVVRTPGGVLVAASSTTSKDAAVRRCELLACGDGRIDRSGRRVPTLTSLGWGPGDMVLASVRFTHQYADGVALVNDFDVLGRVMDRGIEPNYGRVVLSPVVPAGGRRGGLVLPAQRDAQYRRAGIGVVAGCAPRLVERTAAEDHASARRTETYVREVPPELTPGDRVVYERYGVLEAHAGGDLEIVNIEAVLARANNVETVEWLGNPGNLPMALGSASR